MTRETRERLPERRSSETFTTRFGNLFYQVTVGYYGDGRIGEVFVECGYTGSDVNIAMKEVAIAASLALQCGVTVDQICSAFPRTTDGKPEGVMGHVFDQLSKMHGPDLTPAPTTTPPEGNSSAVAAA